MSDLRNYLLAGRRILAGQHVPRFSELAVAATREYQRLDLEADASLDAFRITYAYLDAMNGAASGAIEGSRALARYFETVEATELAGRLARRTIDDLLRRTAPRRTKPI